MDVFQPHHGNIPEQKDEEKENQTGENQKSDEDSLLRRNVQKNLPTKFGVIIVNAKRKLSLRGAKRRGNLMRLLHFVRNDLLTTSTYLSRSL